MARKTRAMKGLKQILEKGRPQAPTIPTIS